MLLISLMTLLAQEPKITDEFRPGLVGTYYQLEGRPAALPEFAPLKPRFLRVDRQLNFPLTFDPFPGTKLRDGVAARWRGVLLVPRDGKYVFFTRSDDGSRLAIDGKRVVDNDGVHEVKEEQGEIELKAGVHEFRVEYFNSFGHNALAVSWKGPGIEKDAIPEKAFHHRKGDEPTTDQLRGIDLPGRPEARDGDREGRTWGGEIAKADAKSVTILVKRDGGRVEDLTFKIEKETPVTVGGEKGSIEDLKPGRSAKVLVQRETAMKIEIARPAPVPEKPVEKPAPKAVEKPAEKPVEKPAPKPAENAFVVDETVVAKTEKQPDLGGRVISLFEDGPLILITIRQGTLEVPFYIPKEAAVTYVSLEKPDQKPTVGYLVYAWLKPGSKDSAAAVRFARK